jgi:tetrathionate reductase subunit B
MGGCEKMRYGMFFDITRCNGCYSCFLACKDEHEGNGHLPVSAATCPGINLIKINEVEYGTGTRVKVDYVPVPCQQCTDPACMKKFPDAVYKRPDGVVIIDPARAKGKKELVDAFTF